MPTERVPESSFTIVSTNTTNKTKIIMERDEILRSFKTVMASAVRTRVRTCTSELVDSIERVQTNNPDRNAGILYTDAHGEQRYFVFSSFHAMMELIPLIAAEEWERILTPQYAGQLIRALTAYKPTEGWGEEEQRNYQRLISLLLMALEK